MNDDVKNILRPLRSLRDVYTYLYGAVKTYSPFTKQFFITALVCAYLILFIAHPENDIIATALTYGLLLAVSLISAYTLLSALIIKSKIQPVLIPPDQPLYAGVPFTSVLHIPLLRSLPGVAYEFSPQLEHSAGIITAARIVAGPLSPRLLLSNTLPHRGNWRAMQLVCSIKDITGFVSFRWLIPIDTSYYVLPPPLAVPSYPILSSSQRAGDIAPDLSRRVGDPYDLKQYHPSDGIKKIVWKVYAKSGELISRHPEPSMTPEGFVGIFVAARRADDDICRASIHYAETLADIGVEVRLACEGMGGLTIADDASSARDLLVDSVWSIDRDNSPVSDLQALVTACRLKALGGTVQTILIFVSGNRLLDPGETTRIMEIGTWLEGQAIAPTFVLTKPRASLSRNNNHNTSVLEKLHLIERQQTSNQSAEEYDQFLAVCVSKGWEVHQ